jgi:hypothetical protein
LQRRDALKDATRPEDMNLLGVDFRALKGGLCYAVHVNVAWCITLQCVDDDADRVE